MFRREHLKRVHSLKVPCCITCRLRFNGKTRAHAEQAQQQHETLGECNPRELAITEPEWMTEEQDARFSNIVIQGQPTSAEDKWRSIYRLIFDPSPEVIVPDPC
jgi:hypothetical protein